MEALGLGVGVLSLAGLFSTCVDCLSLVQNGRYLGQQYLLLETKFANQRLRFVSWGKAYGLTEPQNHNERFKEEEIRSHVENTLVHLIKLFHDEKELRKRYGLRHGQATMVAASQSSTVGPLTSWTAAGTNILSQRFIDLKRRIEKTQKHASIRSVAKWAIEDKEKFAELIGHVKDLVDDLEGITKSLGAEDRQREIIQFEVESVTDIPSLEIMEAARLGRVDPISDAASLQLWKLRDQHLYKSGEQDEHRYVEESTDRNTPDLEETAWDILPAVPEIQTCSSQAEYQHLHRVHCPESECLIFLDKPADKWHDNDNEWAFLDPDRPTQEQDGQHLRDRRRIPDLDSYLKQNSSLKFIILHEHLCRCVTHKSTAQYPPVPPQSIRLVSIDLCNGLRRVAEAVQDEESLPLFSPETELSFPYIWFHRAGTKLVQNLNAADDHSKDHVKLFYEYISMITAEEYAKVDSLLVEHKISWGYLPYLFVPGEILLEKMDQHGVTHYRAYKEKAWPSLPKDEAPNFQIPACSYVHDLTLNLQDVDLVIDGLDILETVFPIDILPYFPMRYDQGAESCLRRNGELLWQSQFGTCLSYTGFPVSSSDFKHDHRFIVDYPTFKKMQEGNILDRGYSERDVGDLPSDPFIFLLPPKFHGFDLQEHRWIELWVSCAHPVIWKKEGFESFTLHGISEELLQDLVMSQMSRKHVRIPVQVTQAAKGTVLIVHDLENRGLSSEIEAFAEAFAEATERPLYRTSESEDLKTNLDLASIWDCVALLESVLPCEILEAAAINHPFWTFKGTLFMAIDKDIASYDRIKPRITSYFGISRSPNHKMSLKLVLDDSGIDGEYLLDEIYGRDSSTRAESSEYCSNVASNLTRYVCNEQELRNLTCITQQAIARGSSRPSDTILRDLLRTKFNSWDDKGFFHV